MVVQVEEAVQAPAVADRTLDRSPADTDPGVNRAISAELTRQQSTGLRARVTRLAGRHPLYPDLTEAGR